MDLYHIWCDLKPGMGDLVFAEKAAVYLGHLKQQGLIEAFRVTRRKLGFGPPGLGEFHLMIETRDLAQLDAAFNRAARTRGRLPPWGELPCRERHLRALSRLSRSGARDGGGAVRLARGNGPPVGFSRNTARRPDRRKNRP